MKQGFFDGTEVSPGYCRALQAGNLIFISGTGALDDHGKLISSDVGEQTRLIYEKMARSLAHFGAQLSDIVRVGIYITDIKTAGQFMKVHSEVFGNINPTATLVEVSGLVAGMTVEIEAQAVLQDESFPKDVQTRSDGKQQS
jgi:enamine deaminase RidA (YjgF/YER057c/UK114 family)